MTNLLIKLFIGKENADSPRVRKKYGFLSLYPGSAEYYDSCRRHSFDMLAPA